MEPKGRDELRRIVVGAGISGASTAYHLRRPARRRCSLGARRAGERRHRQERRDHPPELFDSAARSPCARQHHDVRECARPNSAATPASCRPATASSSRTTCWRARRRTSRCSGPRHRQRMVARAPGFPQHLPEINPDGIAGIVYEPHGGYADPVQATEAYVRGVPDARRRIPRAHAGAAAAARGRSHHRRRARQRRDQSAMSWSTPPARGRSRSPRAPGSTCRCARCASRTRCGRSRRAARFRKPRSRWASMRLLLPAARARPLHHRARLSEGLLRRRSLQLQNQRRRGFHRRRADARRAPLPGVRRA